MRALLVALMSLGLVVTAAPAGQAATQPGRAAAQPGRIVSEEPAQTTPDVLDGTVRSLARVGDQIVVGGNFTQVRNPNTSAIIERQNVFAFDVATGRVSTSFDPAPNGRVFDVEAAPDGRSVYIAGAFTSTWGQASSNVVKAEVASGDRDPAFTAPTLSGQVRDVTVVGGRLWVAGKFTHIGGRAQRALGTLDAATGRHDDYFTAVISGTHRDIDLYRSDRTNVLQIASDPTGESLVAVGNFTSIDGTPRHQIMKLDISGAASALSPWTTELFTQSCSRSFETYMTDVEYSPDGNFFVASTTGAYGGSGSNTGTSGCDVVARFEDGSPTQDRPTWTAYTGGDTTWTVEVTEDVVYAGGHQQWQNNPGGNNRPGPGAVERPGIAALDSVNGLPYSWNPTRSRGVGVEDMLATEEGLYVGSDTTLIGPTPGNRYHARVALLPLGTGKSLPARQQHTLPAAIGTVGVGQSQLTRRTFTGTAVTSSSGVPGTANRPSWGSSVGAFMVNGVLYVGYSNGSVTRQAFDGSSYGPASPVNTADALVRQSAWHDTDVPAMTSLFYADGRMYFTRSGQNTLYSRGFAVESDIVGQQRFTVGGPAGLDFRTVRGAFVADGSFYYSDSQGRLYRTGWAGTGTSTGPVGTRTQVSGPGVDNQSWASRTMFVHQGEPVAANRPPSATFGASCTALTCELDATDSADPDGDVLSFAWDFGDGASATGATTSHTYAAAGARTVKLTVTDGRGGSDSAEQVLSPTDTASPVEFVAADQTEGNRRSHSVRVPESARAGDRLLLFFTANSTSPTYTAPEGWTELESREGTGIVGRVYTRVATAADVGSVVEVTSSAYAKDSVSVAVYRGTDTARPLSASLLHNSASAEHATPTVDVPTGSGWLVSHWAEKSSTATSWQLPAGQTRRAASSTTASSGRVLSVLADTSGTVPSGTQGNMVATADAAGRGITATVLLRAGDAAAPTNRAPVARAADPVCSDLRCTFDGSGSEDPDGDDLTYDWDFGDGSAHGSGPTSAHTYAAATSRTVTLTVTDPSGASDTAAVTARPSEASPTGEVTHVASAATGGNRVNHAVAVPPAVQAGDRLLLVLTGNTTSPSYTGPTGWEPVASRDGRGIVLRAWTRVADDETAGSVSVASSGYAKSTVTITAYRSPGGTPSIAAVEATIDDAPGAEHTSPEVDVPANGGWLVSYWSDKSSDTTTWTTPAQATVRSTATSSGNGHITSVLADSGAPRPAGTAAGLTATASSTSSRGANLSLVISP